VPEAATSSWIHMEQSHHDHSKTSRIRSPGQLFVPVHGVHVHPTHPRYTTPDRQIVPLRHLLITGPGAQRLCEQTLSGHKLSIMAQNLVPLQEHQLARCDILGDKTWHGPASLLYGCAQGGQRTTTYICLTACLTSLEMSRRTILCAT
jgi:hypothetical protein